jgi:hypothetical protein
MTEHVKVLSSNANVELCVETGTNSHLTAEDESGHGFDTEQPKQRARHGTSTDEHVFD